MTMLENMHKVVIFIIIKFAYWNAIYKNSKLWDANLKLEKLGKVNHGLTISRIVAKLDEPQEEILLFVF